MTTGERVTAGVLIFIGLMILLYLVISWAEKYLAASP